MAAPKGNRNAVGNRGGGRSTTYKPEYAKRVYRLILLVGNELTEQDMAEDFGVTKHCIAKWKRDHIEFRKAIDSALEEDSKVAVSTYRRAKGYKHKSEEIFFDPKSLCNHCGGTGKQLDDDDLTCKQCSGSGKLIVRVSTIKKYPPDVKAALAILAKQHKAWQPRRSIEFTGTDNGPIKVDLGQIDTGQLTTETLDNIAELIQRDLEGKKLEKLDKESKK